MIPLTPSAMHARRQPVMVLFVFLTELAWALLVATPVHAWARRAWASHPDGDAVLWKGGGRELLIWLGQEDAGSAVTARTVMVLLLAGILVMQLPLGALLASLAFSRAETGIPGEGTTLRSSLRPAAALRIGVAAFMPLAGVLALGSIASIIVIAIGALASSAVDHGLAESMGDARSFVMRLVTFGLFVIIACMIGVIVDLARAAIVREVGLRNAAGTSSPGWSIMVRGLRVALRVARGNLLKATLAWAGRVVVGGALIAIGYVAAQVLGGLGGAALLLLFFVHQSVVLGRVALRASWLARAMAMIARVQDARLAPTPTE